MTTTKAKRLTSGQMRVLVEIAMGTRISRKKIDVRVVAALEAWGTSGRRGEAKLIEWTPNGRALTEAGWDALACKQAEREALLQLSYHTEADPISDFGRTVRASFVARGMLDVVAAGNGTSYTKWSAAGRVYFSGEQAA